MDKEDVRKAYEATVNYHNTLVQMRFSVASFFAASAAFLVGALFVFPSRLGSTKIVSLLGLVVTIVVWLLELRTFSLLLNLVKRGLEYESTFQLGASGGFFGLLAETQPIGVKVPFLKTYLPNSNRFVRAVFSHTFGLDLLYLAFLVFWAYTLYAA